jgi:hypothetical protein
MRISLMLLMAGVFSLFPKRRLLNVEEAVRLFSGDDAVF